MRENKRGRERSSIILGVKGWGKKRGLKKRFPLFFQGVRPFISDRSFFFQTEEKKNLLSWRPEGLTWPVLSVTRL